MQSLRTRPLIAFALAITVLLPALGLFLGAAPASASEKAPVNIRSQNGPVTEYSSKPLLHEPSGRYFQFVTCRGSSPCFTWASASVSAARRTHEGRRGRLAKPDSAAVHAFLVENFEINKYTWIGLRYICRGRTLVWIDGQSLDSGFGAWDRKWDRSGDFCSQNLPFMPIAYAPNTRWQAIGPGKGFYSYIIEYPPLDN